MASSHQTDHVVPLFCAPLLCLLLLLSSQQSLLDPSKGFKAAALQGDAFSQAVSRVFAFAYVWGLGGNLAPAARAAFDEHVREQLQDIVNIPGAF